MVKIIRVEKCDECQFIAQEISKDEPFFCLRNPRGPKRGPKIENTKIIQPWCPLPDAPDPAITRLEQEVKIAESNVRAVNAAFDALNKALGINKKEER